MVAMVEAVVVGVITLAASSSIAEEHKQIRERGEKCIGIDLKYILYFLSIITSAIDDEYFLPEKKDLKLCLRAFLR